MGPNSLCPKNGPTRSDFPSCRGRVFVSRGGGSIEPSGRTPPSPKKGSIDRSPPPPPQFWGALLTPPPEVKTRHALQISFFPTVVPLVWRGGREGRGGKGGSSYGHPNTSLVEWCSWDPPCDIPSGCYSFTGPWTVTRSALRMLRRVAAFCRPLRPVLLLVSFPRSRSPVVGVLGLCWLWRVPFVR